MPRPRSHGHERPESAERPGPRAGPARIQARPHDAARSKGPGGPPGKPPQEHAMPRVQLGFDQGLVEASSKRRCTKSTSCPRPGRRGPGGGTSSTYSTTTATGTRRSSTTSGPSAESWGSRGGRGPQTRGGEAERRPDGPASDLVSGFSQQGDGASFEGTWEYAAGCCRRIREHAPVDERLHETPTQSQRCRTLARISLDVEQRDPIITPVYQVIASEAAALRARGELVSAIARHLGVDHKTAKKALRWFGQR